jgi:hypothetical protein
VVQDEQGQARDSAGPAVGGKDEIPNAPPDNPSTTQQTMAAIAHSPVLEALQEELGRVTWLPSYDLVKSVERSHRRKSGRGLGLGFIGAAVAGGAALTFSPDSFAVSASLASAAGLLFLGSFWLVREARAAPPFPFAVFEEGVFVPATFENALDVQKFGSSCGRGRATAGL